MKRSVVAAIVCGSAVASAAGVAVASPDTFWTADGPHLANSLQRAGDGIAVPDPCEKVGMRWTCGIEDDPASGWSADYWVTLDRDGCWRGVRVFDPEAHGLGPPDREHAQEEARRGPEPLAACLNVIDYVLP
jgi:hypothetical protein